MVESLLCLLIALQRGGSAYPRNDSRFIALFVYFGVLAIACIITQTIFVPGKERLIPPTFAKNSDMWHAVGYAMCMTGGVDVVVLYLPVWSRAVLHYSALSSGTMLTLLIAGYVVCSVVAGIFTSVIGYYNPGMIIGTALAIAGYQLLHGFGQPSYVVQTILPASEIPVGVALVMLFQNLSASIFVAIAQSIFQGKFIKPSSLSGSLNASSILNSGAVDFFILPTPGSSTRNKKGL